jgi:hypothetical protein
MDSLARAGQGLGTLSGQSAAEREPQGQGTAGSLANGFAPSAAIGQAAAGATQRWISTAALFSGGSSGELAASPGPLMVSRMWTGQPLGGAMTNDETPGATAPMGTPVPGLPQMTQRATDSATMLVFNGLTGEDGAPARTGGNAGTLQVSRAVAGPPSVPTLSPSSGPVMTQRAAASLAPPSNGPAALAGRSMVLPPATPVQREVTVHDVSASTNSTDTSSDGSAAGTPGSADMDKLIDTVIRRLKRQLALDHERAGGFHTSLMR